MLSTVAGWLASTGASLILGWVAALIKDLIDDRRNRQALERAATAERDAAQAKETARIQAELADQAAKRLEPDQAISRLEDGTA